MLQTTEHQSDQEHALDDLREADGPTDASDVIPLVPRRRKDTVDEEPLNDEATGNYPRPLGATPYAPASDLSDRARALALLAESTGERLKAAEERIRRYQDQLNDAAAVQRELVAQGRESQRAIAGFRRERDEALATNADLLAANINLRSSYRRALAGDVAFRDGVRRALAAYRTAQITASEFAELIEQAQRPRWREQRERDAEHGADTCSNDEIAAAATDPNERGEG